jgi:hypothetical protein
MARSLAGCGAERSPASGRRCFQPPRSACWAAREPLIRRGGRFLQFQVRDSLDAAGPQTAGPAQEQQRRSGRRTLPQHVWRSSSQAEGASDCSDSSNSAVTRVPASTPPGVGERLSPRLPETGSEPGSASGRGCAALHQMDACRRTGRHGWFVRRAEARGGIGLDGWSLLKTMPRLALVSLSL